MMQIYFIDIKILIHLQVNINEELPKIHTWLCANRLSLNIKKTSFVIFHSPQKRITTQISLLIHNFPIKQEYCIKYLGILIDSNLNWKSHFGCVAKKIKRGVGILSKLRHFTNIHILKKLYYVLIQPFGDYGIIVWGNTYETTLNPLLILQKRALRIMAFSKSDEHSSPIFKILNMLKKSLIWFLRILQFLCISTTINFCHWYFKTFLML